MNGRRRSWAPGLGAGPVQLPFLPPLPQAVVAAASDAGPRAPVAQNLAPRPTQLTLDEKIRSSTALALASGGTRRTSLSDHALLVPSPVGERSGKSARLSPPGGLPPVSVFARSNSVAFGQDFLSSSAGTANVSGREGHQLWGGHLSPGAVSLSGHQLSPGANGPSPPAVRGRRQSLPSLGSLPGPSSSMPLLPVLRKAFEPASTSNNSSRPLSAGGLLAAIEEPDDRSGGHDGDADDDIPAGFAALRGRRQSMPAVHSSASRLSAQALRGGGGHAQHRKSVCSGTLAPAAGRAGSPESDLAADDDDDDEADEDGRAGSSGDEGSDSRPPRTHAEAMACFADLLVTQLPPAYYQWSSSRARPAGLAHLEAGSKAVPRLASFVQLDAKIHHTLEFPAVVATERSDAMGLQALYAHLRAHQLPVLVQAAIRGAADRSADAGGDAGGGRVADARARGAIFERAHAAAARARAALEVAAIAVHEVARQAALLCVDRGRALWRAWGTHARSASKALRSVERLQTAGRAAQTQAAFLSSTVPAGRDAYNEAVAANFALRATRDSLTAAIAADAEARGEGRTLQAELATLRSELARLEREKEGFREKMQWADEQRQDVARNQREKEEALRKSLQAEVAARRARAAALRADAEDALERNRGAAQVLEEHLEEEERLRGRVAGHEAARPSLTPRPDWSALGAAGDVFSERGPDGRPAPAGSSEAAAVLFSDRIVALQHEIADLVEQSTTPVPAAAGPLMFRPAMRGSMRFQYASDGNSIAAHGTSSSLPRFLRFNGKIKRREFTVDQARLMVQEMFATMLRAERPGEPRLHLGDAAYLCLQRVHGTLQAVIADHGYNLMAVVNASVAADAAHADPELAVFKHVINNALDADVYFDLQAQLMRLRDYWARVAGGEVNRALAPPAALAAVAALFGAAAGDGRLEGVRAALEAMAGGKVGAVTLEAALPVHGGSVVSVAVLRLLLADREAALQSLTSCLEAAEAASAAAAFDASADPDGSGSTSGGGIACAEVGLRCASCRKAVAAWDPRKDAAAVEAYVARGFGAVAGPAGIPEGGEGPAGGVADDEATSASDFMDRLRSSGVVRRDDELMAAGKNAQINGVRVLSLAAAFAAYRDAVMHQREKRNVVG